MSENPVMTKAELLAAIDAGWNDLQTYLATLTPDQLTVPTDAAGWTVKDHLMHIVVWEESIVPVLEAKAVPEAIGIDRETWDIPDIDRQNEVIRQHSKALSWAQMREKHQQIHDRLIDKLQTLSDADLRRPYNYFQPNSKRDDPVLAYIVGNSFGHYAEHLPWIQAIVASAAKAEVIAAMQRGFNEFNAYLDTLTEAQLTQLTDAAGWTVKDHVIHLAVWEDSMNTLLAGQNRMLSMGIDDPAAWAAGDWDKINAVIQQQNKDLSLAEVRQRFQQFHDRLIAKIESLSDEELQRPYNSYQPTSTYTAPVLSTFWGNTADHYAEHRPWIAAIVFSER